MMEDEAPIAHGGALDEARQRHPFAPEPWIDLSTGINPVPYPLPPVEAGAWARLPLASEELALREAAAARYGAAGAANIVAAPGTQALIQLLPRLVPPGRVAVLGPTYAEHAAAWKREGHDVYEVATLAGAETARAVVAVNPNNPTGRLIPVEDLRRAAQDMERRGGLLVLDEAFMDVMAPSASLIPGLPSGALVLRSFGKMYGLAGLRLGFAVAEERVAARIREMLGPWAVPGPAIAIGRAALADGAWLAEARARLASDAARLDAMLEGAGCRVLGGTALFRLAAHPSAQALAETLAAHGILVRRFSYEPGWLRFGIPGDEGAWLRLEAAIGAAGKAGNRHPGKAKPYPGS